MDAVGWQTPNVLLLCLFGRTGFHVPDTKPKEEGRGNHRPSDP